MLKQTVTFENFNDETVSQDLYFNLTVPELLEMETSIGGGLSDAITTIIKTEDKREILNLFKKIVFAAYGVKSDDGNRFVKSEELNREFEQSAAYDEFFIQLLTNEDTAASFIGKLLPKSLGKISDKVEAAAAKKDDGPKKAKDMTKEELMAAYTERMSQQ